ncbi:MAG: domain containing protein, partial [Verrucomicrobiales bacterium]|nr:domain containing protein [Verrucomicrobiales bacterium]
IARVTISPLTTATGYSNLVVIAGNGTNAPVVLNGKASSDPDNDPLTFAWLDGTNFLSSAALTTNTLNVGTHEIQLSVNDGGSTASVVTNIQVISTGSSLEALIAFVKSTHLNPRNEQSLLASLYAAQSSLAKGSIDGAISHLVNFQSKVRSQIAPINPTLAQKFIRDSQAVINALRPLLKLSTR